MPDLTRRDFLLLAGVTALAALAPPAEPVPIAAPLPAGWRAGPAWAQPRYRWDGRREDGAAEITRDMRDARRSDGTSWWSDG